MPKATVDPSVTERLELRTCPEGWVDLRKLSYGEYLERRDMAVNVTGSSSGQENEMVIGMMQRRVAAYEMKCAVVTHNLTDANDQLLDFKSPRILDVLDPQVGQEIGDKVDEMNSFEADLKE